MSIIGLVESSVLSNMSPSSWMKSSGAASFLSSESISSLSVTVIFSKTNDVIKWKNKLASLNEHVLNILYNQVLEECNIISSKREIAKLLGIHSIQVKSCSNFGLVTKKTEILVDSVVSFSRFKQSRSKRNRIGGLDSIIKSLTDLVLLSTKHGASFRTNGLSPPRGILLQGPPGCGKTSLVKQVAQDLDAFVLVVNESELLGSRPGETQENLDKVFMDAENQTKEGICLLFLDELDAMCGVSERAEDARVVAHLCGLLDRSEDLIVIGATNRPDGVHRALRRPGRMDREIFIGIPSVTEREEILTSLTRDLPLSGNVDLPAIAEAARGYVGADLAQLCREAALSRLTEDKQEPVICMQDFTQALHVVRPSTARASQARVDFRPLQWYQIGGLDQVKAQIKQAVEWPISHPESFRRLGLPPPRGVLLYGPPGCAKTSLVRAAATSCGATFLSVTGAQIYSPYVGDSEKTVAQVFHEARLGAPSILFLDELDSIVGTRGSSQTGVQERVLSTLLTLMDGVGVKVGERTRTEKVKVREGELVDTQHGQVTVSQCLEEPPRVLVVGATNRPDLIDSALLRPGRMDRVIYVQPPDTDTRHHILSLLTSRMPLADDVDLRVLAEMTELFTGADLESLCNETGLLALTLTDLQCTAVTMNDFTRALSKMAPSLTAQQILDYSNCWDR